MIQARVLQKLGGLTLAVAAVVGGFAGPVRLTGEQDRQRLMDLLKIQTLRPGRNGSNRQDPNFANYDEAKANPYPTLPDALTLKNGRKVTKAADWWSKRRPEIVEDFDREVYGRVPKNVPKVKWEVTSTTPGQIGGIDVITRQLVGVVDNRSYPDIEVKIGLSVITPANAGKPVPVILQFGGGFGAPASVSEGPPFGPGAFAARRGGGPPPAAPKAPSAARGLPGGLGRGPSTQQLILERGWAYASINTGSIQADSGEGLTLGIIGLVNQGQPRKVDDWGVLRAWAWGASRALDYLETDKAVDAKHVALEGHSRWGKATIVAVAYDQRFWTGYVSSSGEAGAKLHRRDWGETVQNMANLGAHHWMAGNFLKYSGPLNAGDLPVDSHELIALCAPRPVFIGGGKSGYDAEPGGDSWVDPKGSFMAAAAAGPVYALLGAKPLPTSEFPSIETLVGGDADLAFRQHSGGHTDGPNWPVFLDFAAKHLK